MFCCLSNCVYFVAEMDAMWDICSVSLHTTSVLLLTTHWGSIMLLITVDLPGSNAGARGGFGEKTLALICFSAEVNRLRLKFVRTGSVDPHWYMYLDSLY